MNVLQQMLIDLKFLYKSLVVAHGLDDAAFADREYLADRIKIYAAHNDIKIRRLDIIVKKIQQIHSERK